MSQEELSVHNRDGSWDYLYEGRKSRPLTEMTPRKWLYGTLALILLLILGMAVVFDPVENAGTKSRSPAIAATGAAAAISEEAYDRVQDLAIAGDSDGVRRLMLAGLAISLDGGTKVRVIDLGFLTTEVKVEEGPYTGMYLIVATEHIVR